MKIYRVYANNSPKTRTQDYDFDVGMRVYIRIEQEHMQDALVRKLFYQYYSADTWAIQDISEVDNVVFGDRSWEITD